jgi:hypothetical protein
VVHNKESQGPYRVSADEKGPGVAMSRSFGDFLANKKWGLGRPRDPTSTAGGLGQVLGSWQRLDLGCNGLYGGSVLCV